MHTDKAVDNYMQYIYARDNGHLRYLQKAALCRRFFLGKHWDEAQEAMLKASGRPVLTINKVFSTMLTVMGEQIATQADISFQPTASGIQETADALTKLWISTAQNNSYQWLEEMVFDSGAVTSRGFFDVRMAFDDHLKGEVRIKAPNAQCVLLDPDDNQYDPRTWSQTLTSRWLSLNDIELLWGPEARQELESRSRSRFEYGYDSIDMNIGSFGNDPDMGRYARAQYSGYDIDERLRRMYRLIERQHKEVAMREHFVDLQTGDTRVIPSTWDRNRIAFIAEQYKLGVIRRRAEQIRWTQSIEDVLLFDKVSPYKWFTQIPYFPIFFEGQTIGLVENLLSPQEQLNKLSSQELHVVNTTANSGWKVKAGSLQNMDIYELEQRGAETGLVIELADVKDLEKLSPNPVPTGLDRLTYKADEAIKDLSGISDSLRGFDRADVAAKAIRAKQQAGSVNLTKAFRNLLHTRHLVAKATLDLVQTYYTEERVFKVNGNGILGEPETVTVNGMSPEGEVVNDLQAGEYEVVVTDVPKRESFEESQFDEATRLRELGVNIPDDVIIEASHLSNKRDIAQRVRERNGESEPTEMQQQLAQLEVQLKQVEVEEKQAEVMRKKADAALQLVRAQGEALDQGNEDKAQELLLKAEEAKQQLALKREELQATLQLKREEAQEEMKLRRMETMEKLRLQRAEAEERLEIMRQTADAQAAATLAKADAQAKAAQQKQQEKPNGD